MKRAFNVIFLLIFFLACVLPSAQLLFKFAPEEKLAGTVVEISRPKFSLNTWKTGEFQTQLEQWWNQHLGFRGALIKTVNQLNFNLFREISAGGNVKIVYGQNNMLYEKGYINHYHGRNAAPYALLKNEVTDLVALQTKLAARGVPLIVVLAPSKASVYPEYLPGQFAVKQPGTPATDYERIKPLLKQAGITVIDGTEILLTEKKTNPNLLFAHGGTHWNYYAACIVQEKIMQAMEQKLQKPLVHLVCDPPVVDNEPIGTDRDLADLMNLWDNTVTNGATPHPLLKTTGPKDAFRPTVAAIGDSFVWTISEVQNSVKLYQDLNVYYYFESKRHYPGPIEPNAREQIDWERDFFSKDIIMIETNEVALNTLGFGFVDAALQKLK